MRHLKKLAVGLLLAAAAGSASAQDGGNVVAALNDTLINLNSVLGGVVAGDVTGATNGVNGLVGSLAVDLTDGTPLAGLGEQLAGAGDQLTGQLKMSLTPTLDGLAAPLAKAASPVTGLYFPSALLASGLPLVSGENVVLLEESLGLGQSLRKAGVPVQLLNELLKIDLLGPGDNDGGGVALPLFGGEMADLNAVLTDIDLSNGLPLLNDGGLALLGSTLSLGQVVLGGLPVIGDLGGLGGLPLAGNGGIPIVGGLLGGDGGIPVIGGLLGGGGAVLGGGQGLALNQLPLSLDRIDTGSLLALANGASLPGLE